jgi:hypothetical protein
MVADEDSEKSGHGQFQKTIFILPWTNQEKNMRNLSQDSL